LHRRCQLLHLFLPLHRRYQLQLSFPPHPFLPPRYLRLRFPYRPHHFFLRLTKFPQPNFLLHLVFPCPQSLLASPRQHHLRQPSSLPMALLRCHCMHRPRGQTLRHTGKN
jgi:hypothetical protein